MPTYYYCTDGQHIQGPLAEPSILKLYSSGSLPATTQICLAGSEQWIPITDISEPKQNAVPMPVPAAPAIVKPSFLGTPLQWGSLAGFILLVIVALGFVHIIFNNKLIVGVVPKQGFTYAMTFVSVDDVINRYNNRTLGSAMRGDPVLDYLVEELERKEIISTKKRTWKEVEDNVKRSLPDK